MNEDREKRGDSGPEEARRREKTTWELTQEGMLQEKRVEELIPEEEEDPPALEQMTAPASAGSGSGKGSGAGDTAPR